VKPYYEHAGITLFHGDCREAMIALPDASVDAVVTDPPYGLSFMGKRWDYDVPTVEVWQECLRVLKPGGHLLAFAGTRTQHRMAVRIEDAGFEIRDMIAWVYGSGFPKSLDVSKAIDRMKDDRDEIEQVVRWMEATRQATGITRRQVEERFGTVNIGQALFTITPGSTPRVPTLEQVDVLLDLFKLSIDDVPQEIYRLLIDKNASKGQPGPNWLKREVVGYKTGSQHADGRKSCFDVAEKMIKVDVAITAPSTEAAKQWAGWGTALKPALEPITVARKPLSGTVAANVLRYGTGGINVDACRVEGRERTDYGLANSTRSHGSAYASPSASADFDSSKGRWPANLIHDGSDEVVGLFPETDDEQSAARFFYTAKADKSDRGAGNNHPTVKPVDLMRYLVRLVCPMGGIVLDPFNGSGTTAVASRAEHCRYIGAELSEDYCRITIERLAQGVLF
jgi:DNA modification methylase